MSDDRSLQRPVLTFPYAESALVRAEYSRARIILEYGSGGSTVLAAEMPNKLVISVESDFNWLMRLQAWLDAHDVPSNVILWPVDIGSTGRWGRPVDQSGWRKYRNYPLSVWSQPFFRHPDLILIDGRFRAACLIACYMRVQQPTTVLFDDYIDRPLYHEVENIIRPSQIVGRMAKFHLEPTIISPTAVDLLLESITRVSLDADSVDYSLSSSSSVSRAD